MNPTTFRRLPLLAGALAIAIAIAGTAPAQASELGQLINAYRAAPGACGGAPALPAATLSEPAALSRVRIGPGTFIQLALEKVGYAADHAEALSVTGPDTAIEAMAVLQEKYCKILLNPGFAAVGSYRDGKEWTVVLARPSAPLPSETFPDWVDAGQAILAGVNAARAGERVCGDRRFGPAPPLSWNPALGQAALAHSRDMAAQRYFNHKARDGSQAGDRAARAGYRWRRVGENIAFGQASPQEAVDGWLDSPGHCANIMNPDFTEMGAAYGIAAERRSGLVYWTQVFATQR